MSPVHSLSFRDWTKHVGHHFEQLALFALPHALFDDKVSNDSDVFSIHGLKDVSGLITGKAGVGKKP